MSRKNHLPVMLIGALIISICVYLALAMKMSLLLLLPPLYTCVISFIYPRWVAVTSTVLSGMGLLIFVDPLHATLYTLAGGTFGILVYVLSHTFQRAEAVVVLMGGYLSALYMAYVLIVRSLYGTDVHAGIKKALVEMFGSELVALGVDVSDLLHQMTSLSFGGMFVVGGAMALWTLYTGARLAAARGIPVLVPNFLAFRLKELTFLPLALLFGLLYMLSLLGGTDFWQMATVLILILLFLFSLQGISFIAWWRAKRGKTNHFFYLFALLLFLIPLGQITLGLLGFIENMTRMRKIGG